MDVDMDALSMSLHVFTSITKIVRTKYWLSQ
jgi:hypothetical protein